MIAPIYSGLFCFHKNFIFVIVVVIVVVVIVRPSESASASEAESEEDCENDDESDYVPSDEDSRVREGGAASGKRRSYGHKKAQEARSEQ